MLQKLRLFDAESGDMFPVERTLESLLGDGEGQICSGSDVIVEYVASDSHQLPDVQGYK